MKIIVAYAWAGAGHFKAAEAVYDYLKIHYPQTDLKLIDALKKSKVLFRDNYIYGYPFLVKYLPFLWGLGFWITSVKPLRYFTRCAALITHKFNTGKFARYLISENPDFIISTHFLPSEISASLKAKGKIGSRVITVITDFGIHPYWIARGTDIYVVASDSSREKLVSEGIAQNQIKVFGIPVSEKFLRHYDRGALCDKFGIDKNKFTVLIITGSFGTGPIEEIIRLLSSEGVQVLAVCANNKKLYEKLKDKNYPGVCAFGFVDNIQELMAVASIIVTKPGGLSIAESLNMDLLPIFISAIPGQEVENMKVLLKSAVGINLKSAQSVKETVLNLKAHPEELCRLKENIRKIKKPFATGELCDALCKGSLWAAD